MSRFVGIPSLPQTGAEEWLLRVIGALKQDVELLMGARGEADGASRAIIRSSLTVARPPEARLVALTSSGSGYTISGVQVPSLADYQNLMTDVNTLRVDLAQVRATLDALIAQLRG